MPPAQGATRPVANWLERIRVGWTRYLSEPRYKLVVLRALVAKGRASRRRTEFEQLFDFLFPRKSGDTPQANKQTKRHLAHLPNELFPRIARYYWGGET
mmetsp:Transcript_32963/g.99299  ORF Transcript_32963/g.99299 Transcript_32963/m.99299 type:complete len:99 (-) Transcript_32963:87-383(-)